MQLAAVLHGCAAAGLYPKTYRLPTHFLLAAHFLPATRLLRAAKPRFL